jgi:diacylglycerol kinase (ATP)
MKKALFLYSGLTGAHGKLKLIEKAIARLSTSFDLVSYKTSSVEELKEKAQSSCSYFDVLLVAGGDGTFHQAINAIASESKKPILGFINAGTMGDVSASFGLSHSFWDGVKTIEEGHFESFDVCKANDVFFIYMAATGAYANVAYKTSRKKKKSFGKLAYYSLSAKEAMAKKEIALDIAINGERVSYNGPFFMALNGPRVGGFYVNKIGQQDDGRFEAYLTPSGSFNGLTSYLTSKRPWCFSSSSAEVFSPSEREWCLDGEPYIFKNVKLTCLQKEIMVFCREKAK